MQQLITGKHLPRRAFLRGAGAAVALPFLEAMAPAGRFARTAAAATDVTRLVCIEEVHGLAGCNEWGASRHLFAPAAEGSGFELPPDSALKGLEPFRDYLTIVSNTDVRMAEASSRAEVGGDHYRSSAVFLTQAHPRQTQGSDLFVGTSLDQRYAQRFGQATPMPSMQLCIENLDRLGGCPHNYSCAYTNSISWSSPSDPLPMIRDPRAAFEMLFGAGGAPAERAERLAARRSILDWILADAAAMRKALGPGDRRRMDRYLDHVREVERRIRIVEGRGGGPRAIPPAPLGVPESFSEHMRIMFDLQVLAMETDMTRVISFKTGRDFQNRVFPESGTSTPFHAASHHGGKPEKVLEFNKICRYRVGQLAYFLERLQDTVEGGRPLIDRVVILWGSPMADGNLHSHRRCPLLLLGKGGGVLAGNLHLRAKDGTPMANVMLALLQSLGMEMDRFGDSTGTFALDGRPAAAAAEARRAQPG